MQNFLRTLWVSISITALTIIGPLICGIIIILLVGYGFLDTAFFQRMEGNRYLANNILIVFIFVSYFIVLISLLLYLRDMSEAMFKYKGESVRRKTVGKLKFFPVAIALLAPSIFCSLILVCFYGFELVTYRNVIDWNKWITVVCFGCFSVIDVMFIYCKRLELEELEAKGEASAGTVQLINNEIDFSTTSTLLINIPTIAITFMIAALLHFIQSHPASFLVAYDSQTHLKLPSWILNVDWFLFLDGVETGVIVASIIMSQIIFAFVKLRFQYQDFRIRITTPVPTVVAARISST